MRFLIALLIMLSLAQQALAEEVQAREIIRRMDSLMRGETTRGLYEMTITTPKWERTLKLQAWEKSREKTFIRIISPPKERDVGTLRIGYEMWNYLPSVERVIKVPPSMMLQSWMGSDFTNDDLVRESSVVNDYEHRTLGTETTDGFESYRVEAVPREDAPVVWGRIVFWVRKTDFVPLRQEFYDEKDVLQRVMTFSDIKEMGGRTIPTLWEMRPIRKQGKKTALRILDVEFDEPIDEDVFTLSNLKQTSAR